MSAQDLSLKSLESSDSLLKNVNFVITLRSKKADLRNSLVLQGVTPV